MYNLKTSDKVFNDLLIEEDNELPIDFEILKVDHSSSHHIIDFLTEIFCIKKSHLTEALSTAVIELDNLAKKIDNYLDNDKIKTPLLLNVSHFPNLEKEIISCLSALKGLNEYEKLVPDTLQCVNTSLISNTTQRHLIYNLHNDASYNGCTVLYLFPLINFTYHLSSYTKSIRKLFFLYSNYVQLLDDFCDLFEDLEGVQTTPVVVKYRQNIENKYPGNSPFISLSTSVIKKLNCYFLEFQAELEKILCRKIESNTFYEWKAFNDKLYKLKVPYTGHKISDQNFLKRLHDIVPPIVCYDV